MEERLPDFPWSMEKKIQKQNIQDIWDSITRPYKNNKNRRWRRNSGQGTQNIFNKHH